MTPGVLTVPISKGAKYNFTFNLVEPTTRDPIDLTGLGPFVCEVKSFAGNRLLVTATVTSAYDATGQITITMNAAQTATLPLGQVRMGVRDDDDEPYMEGTPEVVWFTPTS